MCVCMCVVGGGCAFDRLSIYVYINICTCMDVSLCVCALYVCRLCMDRRVFAHT